MKINNVALLRYGLAGIFFLILFFLSVSDCCAEKFEIGNDVLEVPIINGYSKIEPDTKQFAYLNKLPGRMERWRVLLLALAPSDIADRANNGEVIHNATFIMFSKDTLTEDKQYSVRKFRKEYSEKPGYINAAVQKLDWESISNGGIDGAPLREIIRQNIRKGTSKIVRKATFENGILSFTMLGHPSVGDAILISKASIALVRGKIVYLYIHKVFNERQDLTAVDKLSNDYLSMIKSAN